MATLTDSIAYLQRISLIAPPLSQMLSSPELHFTKQKILLQVQRIGKLQKEDFNKNYNTLENQRFESQDLIDSMYGTTCPIAFHVNGNQTEINVAIGSWSETLPALQKIQTLVQKTLQGIYPYVETVSADFAVDSWTYAGFALGTPTRWSEQQYEGFLPIERLIRALKTLNWGVLILAEPLLEEQAVSIRNRLLNEMREYSNRAENKLESPALVEKYTDLLKIAVESTSAALASGLWRTAIYLFGDENSYPILKSLWKGVFSGNEKTVEPIKIYDDTAILQIAKNWDLPNIPPNQKATGFFEHAYQYQSILSSAQLSKYLHFPTHETPGFGIDLIPEFNATSKITLDNNYITLGKIVQWNVETMLDYILKLNSITKHIFISGVTGSGKTNTSFYLLNQLVEKNIPFMILEPAKAEYREFLNNPNLRNKIQIFTLGNETVSPFRINPFEVVDWIKKKTPISVHLDLLRSVFEASFGMWTPLPQVLELCLHRIYEDRGWDVTSNSNSRILEDNESDVLYSFPTLSDLYNKIEEVTNELGYEDKIASDILAALQTRVNSLRTGGKGMMLDVQYSYPTSDLLKSPAILELEGMGDDDDKAFMMGLLFIRMYEHRRAEGESNNFKHLLVIEEAHRLLSNVENRNSEETGNPKGKAIETFTNLISEIRAYGQGLMIADQVPARLAPDVIKNTGLKIVHRIVAEEDRKELAGSMNMQEKESYFFSTLPIGRAIVFGLGDDKPILIEIPENKKVNIPADENVKATMRENLEASDLLSCYAPSLLHAELIHEHFKLADDKFLAKKEHTIKSIIENNRFRRLFSRIVLTLIADADSLETFWSDFDTVVSSHCSVYFESSQFKKEVGLEAAIWIANKRGVQSGWLYSETNNFAKKLATTLFAKIDGKEYSRLALEFRNYALQILEKYFVPCEGCSIVYEKSENFCIFQHWVNEVKKDETWDNAFESEIENNDGSFESTCNAGIRAAYLMLGEPTSNNSFIELCLCYTRRMLSNQFDSSVLDDLRRLKNIKEKLIKQVDNGTQ